MTIEKTKKSFFGNLSLRTKMVLGFGFLTFFFLLVTLSTFTLSFVAGNALRFVTNEQVEKIATIEKMSSVIQETKVFLTTSLLTVDQYLILQNHDKIQTNIRLLNSISNQLQSYNLDSEEAKLLSSIQQREKEWGELVQSFLDIHGKKESETANILYVRGIEPGSIDFLSAIHKLYEFEKARTDNSTASVLYYLDIVKIVVFLIGVLFLSLGFFLSRWVINSVTGPVRIILKLVDNIRQGNLAFVLNYESGDEMGEMVGVIDEMRTHLQKSINMIRESVDSLSLISKEFEVEADTFKQSSLDVSQSSKFSADAIQDLNTSMTHVESMLIDITGEIKVSNTSIKDLNETNEIVFDSILDFSKKAQHTSEGAETVANNLKTAEEAMIDIRKNSDKIQDVISIITEISDQTNLLSLNASIEAARAGEHGRGFAVVAEEISKLADKTLNSVKEVSKQIKESRVNIDHGTKVFHTVGEYFGKVYEDVSSILNTSNSLSQIVQKQKEAFLSIQRNLEQIQSLSNRIEERMKVQKVNSERAYSQVTELSENSQAISVGGYLLTVNSEKLLDISKRIEDSLKRYKTK
ncbi:MAG: methyl-accepting chemotaxis protein [Leptospira sp.]|nr:methyl-accepting chemotaxis protein [Leptospira sp.]